MDPRQIKQDKHSTVYYVVCMNCTAPCIINATVTVPRVTKDQGMEIIIIGAINEDRYDTMALIVP